MKISVNDQELFTLSDIQKQVICNDIAAEDLDSDLKGRLQWVLIHKYEECLIKLKNQWDSVLAQRYDSVPTNRDAYAKLVFSQPDYKDQSAREAEGGR